MDRKIRGGQWEPPYGWINSDGNADYLRREQKAPGDCQENEDEWTLVVLIRGALVWVGGTGEQLE